MLFGHIIPRSAAQEAGKQEAHKQELSGALMDKNYITALIQPFARLFDVTKYRFPPDLLDLRYLLWRVSLRQKTHHLYL